MNVETVDHHAAAEMAYKNLVTILNDDIEEARSLLLDEESPLAINYRGLLLGRPWGTGATYKELYWSRLKVDVSHSRVELDVRTGQITTHVAETNDSLEVITNQLQQITNWILMAFPVNDQRRFKQKGVVNALHGINCDYRKKKKAVHYNLEHHQVGYTKLIAMLHYCLENTPYNNIVSVVTAKQAYNIFVKDPAKDPTGKDRKDVNLNKQTKGYGEELVQFFAKGHLDVQAGFTSEEVGSTSPNSTVTTYNVGPVNSTFQVWVIKNPISDHFMSEVTESMNELEFAKGAGGKKDAFIRVASTTSTPAPLVIGKRILYEGVPMAPIELKLQKLVVTLMDLQTKMIVKAVGRLYKITWHVNLIHTVAASISKAMYGAHTDTDDLLCSDNKDYCHVTKDHWLPKREEMQTATLVISNSKNSESTQLLYKPSTHGASPPMAIPLSNNCLHIQGPGSQAGDMTHQVDIMPKTSNDGSIFRYHCTFRFTLDPKENLNEYQKRQSPNISIKVNDYTETNVIDRCTGVIPNGLPAQIINSTDGQQSNDDSDDTHQHRKKANRNNGDDSDDDSSLEQEDDSSLEQEDHIQQLNKKRRNKERASEGTPADVVRRTKPVGRYNLKSELCRDTYPNLPQGKYDYLFPPHRAGPRVRLGGSMVQELSSGPMVRMMFNKNYLLDVVHDNVSIPCLHHVKTEADGPWYLPIPGERYQMNTILADAGLNHTDRSHPIISTNEQHHNVMVLSQSYKNDADSINKYLSKVKDWVKSDRKGRLFDDSFNGDIHINGSGGSPTGLGTYAPSPSANSKDDAQLVLPFHQDMEHKINKKLGKMVMEGKVVAVYLNEHLFVPPSDKGMDDASNDQLLFLGHFWCTSYRIHREDTDDDDQDSEDEDDKDEDDEDEGDNDDKEEEDDNEKDMVTLEDELQSLPVGTQLEQMYSRFRLAPHIEATLSPILRDKQLKVLLARRAGTDNEQFRVVNIPAGCEDKIEMEIGIGEQNNAASLHPKKKFFGKLFCAT